MITVINEGFVWQVEGRSGITRKNQMFDLSLFPHCSDGHVTRSVHLLVLFYVL